MAFPIIPRVRSGAAGYPAELNLGELAVNTFEGSLYLGCDSGVAKINSVGIAGSTITEWTATEGQTVFTGINGYVDTADGSYLVSVGGVDQPGSAYAITSANSGTLTLASGAPAGVIVAVRAFVGGTGGGGGSTNATQLQGRAVSSATPNDGQVLTWNATSQTWEPQGGGGSVTFNTVGVHYWQVPANVRYAQVVATSQKGGSGTNGENGQNGIFINMGGPANGANGADGVDGAAGSSIKIAGTVIVAGGAGGAKGYGGGGGGGPGMDGSNGNGQFFGYGGKSAANGGNGGNGANDGIIFAEDGQNGDSGGNGGNGAVYGGIGGIGSHGGGGGGGGLFGGGGGGGGGDLSGNDEYCGSGGAGGQGQPGQNGSTITMPYNFSAYAGGSVVIEITAGSNQAPATITITW